jgi:hypothetical protein
VFRAESPDSSCDLIALKNGKCVRVEVKHGRRLASGRLSYSTSRLDESRYDVLAIMVMHHGIVYIPRLTP